MPIGSISPFRPTGTVGMTATTAASNIALSGGGDTIVVTNPSTALIFVRFGSDATVAATNSDMPVLPNNRVVLAVNSLITYASAISSSASGTILFSRGDGSVV
jgi:hypothetical protein